MGHDLPRAAWPTLINAIAEHAHAADARAQEHTGDGPAAASPSAPDRPASLSEL
jgi:hypothetical protein